MHFSIESYTHKFDYETSAGAKTGYMIAAVPRTGSTYLCHRLWRTGLMGAPLEYLNPAFYEITMREDGIGDLLSYWRSIIARRTSPNGVFGWKMFPSSYLRIACESPDLLPHIAPSHVIYLSRRNRVQQAISYALAIDSGAWYDGVRYLKTPVFDRKKVDSALEMIAKQYESWDNIFAHTRTPTLKVYYEDLIEDWATVSQNICAFCGEYISLGHESAMDVALPAKQASAHNRLWLDAYESSLNNPI